MTWKVVARYNPSGRDPEYEADQPDPGHEDEGIGDVSRQYRLEKVIPEVATVSHCSDENGQDRSQKDAYQ